MSIGIALVGAGRMGAIHADIIRRSFDARLEMVVDPDTDAARRVAGGAPVVSDLDAALNAEEVDALVVAAPTRHHPGIVCDAIAAGIPVLCEKPLSLDPIASQEIQNVADLAGVMLAVGFWRRFAYPWSRAREMIAAGAIGEPVFVRLSQWDADPPPPAFCARDVSGGLFVDCGVHEFELLEFLCATAITEVRATVMRTVDPAIAAVGDIDNGLVEVHTESGVVAVVDLSRNARYGDDVRTEILGSEGALFIDGEPGGRLRVADSLGIRVVPGTEMVDLLWGGAATQFAAFLDAVNGDRTELADGRASARATAAGEAAWLSVETKGGFVSVSELYS